jgi:hypothetical protein
MTRKQHYREHVGPTARAPALASFHCARPEQIAGRNQKKQTRTEIIWEWIDELAASARFWRTLDVVKRKVNHQPSSLERGSAATRTVVRSISSVFGSDELTHISRINRR